MHEPGLGENYFFHQTPIKTSSRKGPLRDSCTRVLLPALSGTYQLPFAAMFAAGQPKCRYPPKKNLRRSRTRLAASRWELAGRTRITVRAGFGVFVLIPVVPNSFRDDVFFGGGSTRRGEPRRVYGWGRFALATKLAPPPGRVHCAAEYDVKVIGISVSPGLAFSIF